MVLPSMRMSIPVVHSARSVNHAGDSWRLACLSDISHHNTYAVLCGWRAATADFSPHRLSAWKRPSTLIFSAPVSRPFRTTAPQTRYVCSRPGANSNCHAVEADNRLRYGYAACVSKLGCFFGKVRLASVSALSLIGKWRLVP